MKELFIRAVEVSSSKTNKSDSVALWMSFGEGGDLAGAFSEVGLEVNPLGLLFVKDIDVADELLLDHNELVLAQVLVFGGGVLALFGLITATGLLGHLFLFVLLLSIWGRRLRIGSLLLLGHWCGDRGFGIRWGVLHPVGIVIFVALFGDGVLLDRRLLVLVLPVPELLPQDIVDGASGSIGGADVFLLDIRKASAPIGEEGHKFRQHIESLGDLQLLGLSIS